MIEPFHTILFEPLYSGFIFVVGWMPGGSVGLGIILTTLVVRFIIFPFSRRAVHTQAKMRELEPELKEIREKYKNDRQEQARKQMELYRKHNFNPLSGCLPVLIQLPLLIGLFFIFLKGVADGIDAGSVYSFVAIPDAFNTNFLGIVDLTEASVALAAIAGVTQFYQLRISLPPNTKEDANPADGASPSMTEEMKRAFKTQFRYVLPAGIFLIALGFPSAVALYWTTNSTFSLVHELVVKLRKGSLFTDAGGGDVSGAAVVTDTGDGGASGGAAGSSPGPSGG